MIFSHCPTKRIFGSQSVRSLCVDVPSQARIAVVTSRTAWRNSGSILLEEFSSIADRIVIDALEIDQGEPDFVRASQLADTFQFQRINTIIAIGGGSIIDLCKAASVMSFFQGDAINRWVSLKNSAFDTPALDLMVVSTVPGTSSESNNGFVISDPDGFKAAFSKKYTFPKVMAFDPALSSSLSETQLQLGLFDALVHVAEQCIRTDRMDLTNDGFCIAALSTLLDLHRRLVNGAFDSDDLLRFSRISTHIIDSATLGRGVSVDFVTHELAVFLSGYLKIPHASTLACVFPEYLEHPAHAPYRIRFEQLMQLAVQQINGFYHQNMCTHFNLRQHISQSRLIPNQVEWVRDQPSRLDVENYLRSRSGFFEKKSVSLEAAHEILLNAMERLHA